MIALHQFDYVFAIGMMFAFLDAWNIGANDVANSWATSVASRSLTYPQAMCLAAIMEFVGAVAAGSRVTDTIRNKIIDVKRYDDAPAGLMLLMACALVGSSVWLTIATRLGAPVSTTHSIVGAIIGAGIAAHGGSSVHWGWSGFAKIVASWFIAPMIAGCFSIIIFYFTKYAVLERKRSLHLALHIIPIYFFITIAILTMSIVWKGAPNLKLDKLSDGAVVGSILGCGGVAVVVYFLFFYPFFHRRLVLEDWQLKWYDIFYGPALWFRSKDIPPMPEGHHLVLDYYNKSGKEDRGRVAVVTDTPATLNPDTPYKDEEMCSVHALDSHSRVESVKEPAGYRDGKIYDFSKETLPILIKPRNWHLFLWVALTRGLKQDVLGNQMGSGEKKDILAVGVKDMHSRSKRYDLKVEHLYSFLQVITACTASWSHGANDISNACGPLSTIYIIWKNNTTGSKSDVPVWILVYTAAALVIGLWTYGYNLMSNLGNKFILQSPSRGFSIELGAAITTVFASRLAIPISTTQCLVGSTVFVGLANNSWRTVNWRLVLWSYCSWFLTVPCAGLIAGILMGIISNAPRIGVTYSLTDK